MSKYVIKNCPAYLGADCTGFGNGGCKDCTDCVLKQIIELCKHYKKHSDCSRDCLSFDSFLNKVLNKLEIQF